MNIVDAEGLARVRPSDYTRPRRSILDQLAFAIKHLVETARKLLRDASLPGPWEGERREIRERSGRSGHVCLMSRLAKCVTRNVNNRLPRCR